VSEKPHATHVPALQVGWICPRTWAGETAFVLGNGPSLLRADLDALAGRNVIAVNAAVFLRPGLARILFFGDARWYWENRDAVQALAIPRVTLSRYFVDDDGARREGPCHTEPNICTMRQKGSNGLALAPDALCWNRSSGGSAVDLAAHTGASRIVLLGFDMAFAPDGTRNAVPYTRRVSSKVDAMNSPATWQGIMDAARARKIEVLNATDGGDLAVVPRVRLGDVL
jgi:hypothetical protein